MGGLIKFDESTLSGSGSSVVAGFSSVLGLLNWVGGGALSSSSSSSSAAGSEVRDACFASMMRSLIEC